MCVLDKHLVQALNDEIRDRVIMVARDSLKLCWNSRDSLGYGACMYFPHQRVSRTRILGATEPL